jgi:hypothetical protein
MRAHAGTASEINTIKISLPPEKTRVAIKEG